jgi:hypothetical protein
MFLGHHGIDMFGTCSISLNDGGSFVVDCGKWSLIKLLLCHIYLEDGEEEVNSILATMLLTKGGKLDGLLTFVNSPFSE